MTKAYPDDIREMRRDEIRRMREAALAFEAACQSGDVGQFYITADRVNAAGAWAPAFRRVVRLSVMSPQIQQAFLEIWIASNTLPLRVGSRRVLAGALRLLLPGGYYGEPLVLFRGAGGMEGIKRSYGFSWTTDRTIARKFAERWRDPNGVVFETLAPPNAVLLIRKPENHYDEGEVVVDPFRLKRVRVVERLE